jgi:hypothetical protein
MRVCFTDHARRRLAERGVPYGAVCKRVKEAGRMLSCKEQIERRTQAVLVGQEPPIVVEFRPPSSATVVTVLPRQAGAGGKVVKLTC